MDKKDLTFLSYLRNNARRSLTEISRLTSIPVSTLFDRLKTQQDGLITKHATLIDFTKLGYMCRVHIAVKVNIEDRNDVRAYLLGQDCVNSLFKINNGFDFLLEGVFQHVKEMEDFLERLETRFEVKEKDVHYIIEDIEREKFLTNPLNLGFV